MTNRIREGTIDELIPDTKNANKGTKRGRDLHEKSIRNTGFGRSIVVDRHNRIIAGNKTAEIAAEQGVPVTFVDVHGDELVAVRRLDLDLEDDAGPAREMAIADNRVGQVNLDFAEEILAQTPQITGEYWFPEELEALMGEEGEGADNPHHGEENASPSSEEASQSDVETIKLGNHTLVVGPEGTYGEIAVLLQAWYDHTGELISR